MSGPSKWYEGLPHSIKLLYIECKLHIIHIDRLRVWFLSSGDNLWAQHKFPHRLHRSAARYTPDLSTKRQCKYEIAYLFVILEQFYYFSSSNAINNLKIRFYITFPLAYIALAASCFRMISSISLATEENACFE